MMKSSSGLILASFLFQFQAVADIGHCTVIKDKTSDIYEHVVTIPGTGLPNPAAGKYYYAKFHLDCQTNAEHSVAVFRPENDQMRALVEEILSSKIVGFRSQYAYKSNVSQIYEKHDNQQGRTPLRAIYGFSGRSQRSGNIGGGLPKTAELWASFDVKCSEGQPILYNGMIACGDTGPLPKQFCGYTDHEQNPGSWNHAQGKGQIVSTGITVPTQDKHGFAEYGNTIISVLNPNKTYSSNSAHRNKATKAKQFGYYLDLSNPACDVNFTSIPFTFYRTNGTSPDLLTPTYIHELAVVGKFRKDHLFDSVKKEYKDWNSGLQISYFQDHNFEEVTNEQGIGLGEWISVAWVLGATNAKDAMRVYRPDWHYIRYPTNLWTGRWLKYDANLYSDVDWAVNPDHEDEVDNTPVPKEVEEKLEPSLN